MTTIEYFRSHIINNYPQLVLAKQRLESLDTSKLNIGDTCTEEFKAITGISPSLIQHENIIILKANKRSIVFSIGAVVFMGNKHGVIFTELPCEMGAHVGVWTHTWHSFIGQSDSAMKSVLSPTIEYQRGNRLYDYSSSKALKSR